MKTKRKSLPAIDYAISPDMKFWVCSYCQWQTWFEETDTDSDKLQIVLDHIVTHDRPE